MTDQDKELPHFTCPICGAVSYHPKDVEFSYCGRCHAFTAEPLFKEST